MAKEETFILVSLDEEKSKKLAQVISNDTSRKILGFLSKKKTATETDISKELGQPLSTIHYNLKHLMEGGLIQVDEYHYSEKGKEVNHYTLANKFIIIAPTNSESIREKLRKLLPVGLVIIAVTGIMEIFSRFMQSRDSMLGAGNQALMAKSLPEAMVYSAPPAADMMRELAIETATNISNEVLAASAPTADQSITVINNTTPLLSQFSFYFLIGALSAMTLYVVFDIFRSKKKSAKK